MSDFSFLAVPNIKGIHLGWYIQIFGIALLFGICLFFLIYFLRISHRKKILLHQVDDFDQKAQDLGKQLLVQKIQKSSDKAKLILFIEYLEKFVTNRAYANLGELLSSQGFTAKEIEECEHVLYADKQLSKHFEHSIDRYFTS